MSRERGQELKRDIVRTEKQDYDELQRQFAEGEITEQEYEQGVENLLESGDEFLDFEETTSDKAKDAGRSLKEKLAYYSLPLSIIGSLLAVIIMPNLSPMLAIILAPTIAVVASLLWLLFKVRNA